MKLNMQTIKLIKIDSIIHSGKRNMVDISVQDDESFTLADGIISHNSAAKAIQGGRGKNPLIGSFPLKGKPLNVRGETPHRVLGLEKASEKAKVGKKVEPNEIQKILTILGLTIGEPIETVEANDGEWIELDIDGKLTVVNINDKLLVDGEWIKVSTLV